MVMGLKLVGIVIVVLGLLGGLGGGSFLWRGDFVEVEVGMGLGFVYGFYGLSSEGLVLGGMFEVVVVEGVLRFIGRVLGVGMIVVLGVVGGRGVGVIFVGGVGERSRF